MKCIKVPLKELESTRKILMENNQMNMDYRIKVKDNYGYIPIDNNIDEYEIVDIEMEKIKRPPRNITEILKNDLTSEEIENLKTSFDIIGDVVILEIPDSLLDKKSKIGTAALEFTKRKAIYMKKSAVKGTIRVRDLEFLAGTDDPVTIHKEHGCRLKLNVKEVYFSPRLATERLRVNECVEDNENILDMFCGIGPFPILIAKNNKANITSVDINQSAINYLCDNIKLNKLKGSIKPVCGDIGEVSKGLKMKFDRIIMNLPGLAYTFLNDAMNLIEDGGIIHYYEFSNSYEQGIKRINNAAAKIGKTAEILNTRKVKSTSPGIWHIGIDAKISDNKNEN